MDKENEQITFIQTFMSMSGKGFQPSSIPDDKGWIILFISLQAPELSNIPLNWFSLALH